MANTIIQALRDYFLTCPLMDGTRINVDYLPDEGMEYSIDTSPATEVVKTYANGDTVRQYLFVIRSVNDYGSNVLQNIANSGFYERLADWLEEQDSKENYPALPEGMTPTLIEAQSTGYLFTTSPQSGKYQIQCKLKYIQRKE